MSLLNKLIGHLRSMRSVERDAQQAIENVLALTLTEAKARALDLTSNAERFQCARPGLSSNPAIDNLGLVLREFFSEFESVREVNGDFCVSRQAVSRSALRSDFIKVGSDIANSELAVRPGGDRIFVLTDAEHRLDDGVPSIYHEICLLE